MRTRLTMHERRRELANLLAAGRRISTAEAARRFGVSLMTVRRDLAALEGSGLVVRSYGGAVPAQRITFEFAFDARRQRNLDAKRRIGRAAARLVQDGQTVFLDTGTTTLQIARALAAGGTRCTVATSSLVIASELWGREHIDLLLLGGRVRQGSPDLVGPGTELMLDRLTGDIAFVGADGIDPGRGCFAPDAEAARVAERMCRNARRAIVVADGSKLGKAGAVRYLAIAEMGELITDSAAPLALVTALRSRGVAVTVV